MKTLIHLILAFSCPAYNSGFITDKDFKGRYGRVDCISTETSGYTYKYVPWASPVVNFDVKIANDVHIVLAPSAPAAGPRGPREDVYEIVIGGWGNSQSAIRKGHQSLEEMAEVKTDNFVTGTEFRSFWIRGSLNNENGFEIQVGRSGEATPFMSAVDTKNPLAWNYLGLSAWHGITATYQNVCPPTTAPAPATDLSPTPTQAERLVLSSTGGAAEWQGDVLGEYVRDGGSVGRPYYRQRDTVGKRDNFLYFTGQRWWVSDVLGEKTGFLRSSLDTGDSVVPPLSGWEYYSQVWEEEDTSLGLEWGALEPCRSVEVTSRGAVAAGIWWNKVVVFFPTGGWLEGRPVYRKDEGEIHYLRMAELGSTWLVSPKMEGSRGFLNSGRGTVSPGSPAAGPSVRLGTEGWRFVAGGWRLVGDIGWQDSRGQVTFTCQPQ